MRVPRLAGSAIALILLVVTAFPGVLAAGGSALDAGEGREKASELLPLRRYAPGQLMVKFREDLGPRQALELAGGVADAVLGEVEVRGRGKIHLLRLRPGIRVEDALREMRALPRVEYAEPNYVKRLHYTPDDPLFGEQWGYHNTGQDIQGVAGTPDADIDAVEAWDLEKGYGGPPVVAVIDSGVDLDHPDLADQLWVNGDEVPGNGVDDDGNGYVDDYHGYNWAGIAHYSFTDSPWGLGANANTRLFAQSITGTGGYLRSLAVLVSKVGNPDQPILLGVRSSLGGPDLATASIQPSEVPASADFVERELSSQVWLNEGTTYYLTFRTEQNSSSDHYRLFDNYGEGYDWYREGHEWRWDASSSSWVAYTDADFFFWTTANPVPHDDNGHGTHCAGISGARTGNYLGVAGTCPGARVMPLKVADCSGSLFEFDWIRALYYAADNGADVVSMSFGGPEASILGRLAVEYAHDKGVVIFASAGNSGDSTLQYPAGYDYVIGVGATDNRDDVASFSTYNSSVDLSAPGVDVLSTMPTYPAGLNALGFDQDYDFASGTSMACPVAAGVGALLLARNPGLTPEQVQAILQGQADDKGSPGRDDYYGYGRVNAYRSLNAVPQPPLLNSLSPSSGKVGTEVTVSGSRFGASRDGSFVSFDSQAATEYLYWSDGEIGCRVPPLAPGTVQVKVTTAAGTSPGVPFQVLPYTIACTVDPAGSGTVTGAGGYGHGETVTLTAVPAEGYRFLRWTEGGSQVSTDNPYTFTATSDRSLVAHFVRRSTTWYLAEGCTQGGFETWILVQNPGEERASVTLTFMNREGIAATTSRVLEPHTRDTWRVNDFLTDWDVSTLVTSDRPVVAERAMYGGNRAWAHDSVGVTDPAPTWYLAEGCTQGGFETWILVQNPGEERASVTLTFMNREGIAATTSRVLEPHTRDTWRVNDFLTDWDVSTLVTSDRPVVAERAMYGGNRAWAHDSVGYSP